MHIESEEDGNSCGIKAEENKNILQSNFTNNNWTKLTKFQFTFVYITFLYN